MNIKLEEIMVEDNNLLEKMVQLYLHDLSAHFDIEFNSETCEYAYDISTYFIFNKAYFIKEEDKILGFILLEINSKDSFEISEIFVLNNYKSQGIGSVAAKMIFDMYKGEFIIKAVPNSKQAERFWKKTIKEYTNDNYKLEHTGKYNRAEFSFNTKEL